MAHTAQDNAYAEKINKTVKEEGLDYWNPGNYRELKNCLDKAVKNCSTKRNHNHLRKTTPLNFGEMWFKMN